MREAASSARLGEAPRRDELEPIEMASRDEIAALQQERLGATLARAYAHVPHYRAAFDQAGVHPGDFKNFADLARFPFTTKADLRANYPFGMFAVPRENVVRVHASSGTTGSRRSSATRRPTSRSGRTSWRARSGLGRARRHDRARRLWLRALHRRARRALRGGAARLHHDPGVGRDDRAARSS
jgi:hypothetical protein